MDERDDLEPLISCEAPQKGKGCQSEDRKSVQERGGHQLLPDGAALLGAAINQLAFSKTQHCSGFLSCLRT